MLGLETVLLSISIRVILKGQFLPQVVGDVCSGSRFLHDEIGAPAGNADSGWVKAMATAANNSDLVIVHMILGQLFRVIK